MHGFSIWCEHKNDGTDVLAKWTDPSEETDTEDAAAVTFILEHAAVDSMANMCCNGLMGVTINSWHSCTSMN